MTPKHIAKLKSDNKTMLSALKKAQAFILKERDRREEGCFKRSDPYIAVPRRLAITIAVAIVKAERET